MSTLLSRFPKSMPHWGRDRWALAALLLLAWALRLPPILDNRFHPDEALYGYWGLLIGQGQDPWLVTVPVYKPPLLPYLVAGAQALFGNSEFTVRLPGLAAGLLIVPLVAALAYSLYRDRWIAAAAAVGVALSPFAILLSATAFTDPPMVALGLAACIAAARGRPGWAGTLAGLAFATKQTGLLWMPLVALIQISNLSRSKVAPRGSPNPRFWPGWFGCAHHRSGDPGRAKLDLVRLVVRFSLIVGLVFAWDAVRVTRGAESFWRIGVTGYGGLRLTWPQELWPRLRGWIGLMHYFFVSPVVNGALLVGLPALVWNTLGRRHRTRESFADLLLISFSLIYLLLHWLWAFPVWDRYLLPLVPILAILFSRIVKSVTLWLQSAIRNGFDTPTATQPKPQSATLRLRSGQVRNLVHCSLFIFLILPAWDAAHSRYPVGGDHGAYDGIDQAAAFLSDLPEGAVVYHHWLGWHYHYHLFDAPVYLAYWPTPTWLAQDVRTFGAREPRYVTFPSWESPARVEWALAGVGYELAPVLTTTRRDGTPSFTVYRITRVSRH